MSTIVWRKTRVAIGEREYDAEVMDEHNWNGFACPRFTREVAGRIVDDITAESAKDWEEGDADLFFLNWEGDVLELTEHLEPGDTYTEEFEPDADGMYHIGSHSWCWVEVESA